MKTKIFALLLTVLIAGAFLPLALSAASPLSLEATPQKNGGFTLRLNGNGSVRWYALDVDIGYDGAKLEVTAIRGGTVLTDSVVGTANNASGTVSAVYVCPEQSFNSAKSGSILEIDFRIRSGELTSPTDLTLTVRECAGWNGAAATPFNENSVYATLTVSPSGPTSDNTNTGTHTGTDTDTGTNVDTSAGTDTATDTDTDSGTSSDTGTDTDTDTGSGTNAETTDDSDTTVDATDTGAQTDLTDDETAGTEPSDGEIPAGGVLLWIWIPIALAALGGGGFALWFFVLRKKKDR